MSLHTLRRAHARILEHLDQFRACCEDDRLDGRTPAISGWSIGQQVEHSVLADESIVTAIDRLDFDPKLKRSGRPTLRGWLVLLTGHLPRGRAQSPAIVVPRGADAQALTRRLEELRQRVEALEPKLEAIARSSATEPHPALGQFSARQWIRFVEIHERHHLAIIDDIERGPI